MTEHEHDDVETAAVGPVGWSRFHVPADLQPDLHETVTLTRVVCRTCYRVTVRATVRVRDHAGDPAAPAQQAGSD
jgi:hypothetical protein